MLDFSWWLPVLAAGVSTYVFNVGFFHLVPSVDTSLSLVIAALAIAVYPYSALATAVFLLFSILVGYVSWGTCCWLSQSHTDNHSSPSAISRTSLKHRRNIGKRLPCPYPDAWYCVALSEELLPGKVVDATVCGRALVVFRASLAPYRVSVLDAYCPHNGAHLAHGGASLTSTDCIRCPFHGWCFDAEGQAVETGTGEAPPAGSNLRSWPVLERNGVVGVWMSASGYGDTPNTTPQPPPWFEPPLLPELSPTSGGAYVYHGMTENLVPAIIFELPENGADIGHLTALHSAFVVAALRPAFSHAWKGHWEPHDTSPHLARLRIAQTMVFCGFPLPGTVHVEILQCGPSQVYLFFNLPGIGKVVITETVTPVEPTLQRVLHACHAAPGVPRLVAKALLASVIRAYDQDVAVWAHKRYEPAPRLTASEASVKTYRTWVKQFYASPQAISFEQARRLQLRLDLGMPDDSPLDW